MTRAVGDAKVYVKVLNSVFSAGNIFCPTKSEGGLMSHASSSYLARLMHPDSK